MAVLPDIYAYPVEFVSYSSGYRNFLKKEENHAS